MANILSLDPYDTLTLCSSDNVQESVFEIFAIFLVSYTMHKNLFSRVGCKMDTQEKAPNDQGLEFSLSFAPLLYFGQKFTGISVGAGIW